MEQRDHRHEVHEGGIVCIASRIGLSARWNRSLLAAADPERDRDRHREHDRDRDLGERVHRDVPHPEHADRGEAQERQRSRAATGATPARRGSAAPPHTIHQGSPGEQLRAADPACRSSRSSLIQRVIAAERLGEPVHDRCSCRRRERHGPCLREVLLAEHLAADQHRERSSRRARPPTGVHAGDRAAEQRSVVPRHPGDARPAGSTRRSPGRARSPSRRSRGRPLSASPTFSWLQRRCSTSRPRPVTPDDRRDHDHAERHHDRLVHAEHDRGLRQRELHLAQDLPTRGAERPRRPRRSSSGTLRIPRLVSRIAGGRAKITVAISAVAAPDAEQQHQRDQVRERGDRLHRVEDRPQDPLDPGRSARPDPDRDPDQQRADHGERASARASRCSPPTGPAHPSARNPTARQERHPPAGERRRRSPRPPSRPRARSCARASCTIPS